ncbi:MAG: FtsW/RodA/SpoVE family cell cycle protein [Defluviitaleaceae bacterium]|nr:FtsW/RodA/SpoVE family cell cycle protein [Defluviitaleaceae bacterium]
MAKKLRENLRHYDYLLALVTIAISVFGVVMIYTAINAPAVPQSITNRWHWLWERQLIHVISGVVLMIVFAFLDYRWIAKYYIYIFGMMMMLLLVVRFIGTGDGVSRWIGIPIPGFGELSMQPSEFAKLFMIIFLAKFLDTFQDKFNKPLWLLLLLVLVASPVALVAAQPSLSASMVVLSVSLVLLFVGGLYYRTILIGIVLTAPVGILAWLDLQRAQPVFITRVLREWQWQRIATLLDPIPGSDAFRQTEGSLFAIGTGGVSGRGFMNNSYVILGHNDFIFSVAAEQFGFIGSVILLGVVAFIIIRCILIALRAQDMTGRLIAAGVAGMIIFETFFHVGVVTNMLPNTGVPFPFLSYGGSMIWVHMMAIGMVLNVGIPRTKSMFDDEDD